MTKTLAIFAALAWAIATPVPALAQSTDGPVAIPDNRDDAIAQLQEFIDQSIVLLSEGENRAAEPLIAEALRFARELLGEEHPDTINIASQYASTLRDLGRSREAVPLDRHVLRVRRETLDDDDPLLLGSLSALAASLFNTGQLEEAETLLAEALEMSEGSQGERAPDTLAYRAMYAFVIHRRGRSREAEPIMAENIRLSREVLGERDSTTLTNMGDYASVLSALGRSEEAEPLYAEVLQLRREVLGDRDPETITSLNNYAFVLNELGRHEDAIPLFAEALRLAREVQGERHPETLVPLQGYALALQGVGRSAEAEPLLAEALALSRELRGERHPDTIQALNNYAYVLEQIGLLDEAASLHAEALRLRGEVLGERHPDRIGGLINNALVVRNQGRTQEAEQLLAEALQLGREMLGDQHPLTLISMRVYAAVLTETGQEGRALPLFRELAATTRARVADLSDQGLRGMAQQERELADRQMVETFYADGLYDAIGDEGTTPQGLAAEALEALQMATAGSTSRAVAEAAAARFAAGLGLQELVQERQQLAREWTAIEGALVQSRVEGSAADAARQELRAALDAIDARLAEIDAQLEQEAPEYFAVLNQQAVTLEELRGVLGEDEAALFLVPTIYGTQIMAVTDENIRWSRGGWDNEEVAQAVAELRRGLEVDATSGVLPRFDLDLAYDLYMNLFHDVESLVDDKSRIYVIAGGELSRLPLGTLVTREPPEGADPDDSEVLRSTEWLSDRYALVQLPSLQSLVFIRSFAGAEEAGDDVAFTGFGAPVLAGESHLRGARSATLASLDALRLANTVRGSSGKPLMDPKALRALASLPGTQVELQMVSDALQADESALFLAERMTEPAIRNADLSQTRILHIATHGFTSEESGDAAEPGLVFTPPEEALPENDGYLAASEVVGLDLSSADWVILSACNTASPSGRPGETGLSGLAQAFFYAGAESMLVSHWPVFDDIAPVLTVETLRRTQAGQPRAEALQAAIRKVRNDPALDAAHPAVWAPFALVGEGR